MGTAHYTVKFLGSDTSGVITEKMRVNLEGASTPYIDVVVRATVVSDVLYRKSLDFRQQGGKYAPQEVNFKTRSGAPVEILSVEDTGGLLETQILDRKGHRSALKAHLIDPNAVPINQRRHKLIVSTDHEEEPKLEITYRIALPGTR